MGGKKQHVAIGQEMPHFCFSLSSNPNYIHSSPRGLTFSWWGCYSLCHRLKPTKLPTPLYSVLVLVSVFMALSTLFHSITSPDNSSLSHSVLLV